MHPMGHACYRGELNVCKWLFDHGAAEDITTLNNNGESPMLLSCEWGHLPVCEWLFEGARASITKVDNLRRSPIYWASTRGHLKVMQWLFDKGAAADISRSIFGGATPMYMACRAGRMSVCQWLVFNGAMNRRAAARKIHYRNDDDDDDDDDEIENESIGHADEKVVQLDTAHDNGKHRLALSRGRRASPTRTPPFAEPFFRDDLRRDDDDGHGRVPAASGTFHAAPPDAERARTGLLANVQRADRGVCGRGGDGAAAAKCTGVRGCAGGAGSSRGRGGVVVKTLENRPDLAPLRSFYERGVL